MIEVKAPGKLYISGEYAVTEPGHKALLIALNRFVTAKVIETDDQFGTIHSTTRHPEPVPFLRNNHQITVEDESLNTDLKYITQAIETFEAYVISRKVSLKNFHLIVDSELDDRNGSKYGLGSSAAILVSIIKSLNELYQTNLSHLYLYKLAVIANMKLQSLSSCGDIAVSMYTGWLAYSTFDHDWVSNQIQSRPINEVITSNWPGLYIEPLQPPEQLDVLIGWTGSPASSDYLVSEVKRLKSDLRFYENFLEQSRITVENLIQAFKSNNIPEIMNMIRQSREVLQLLDQAASVDIETPQLKKLCSIAEKHQAAAKSSGAGGGDCGIALITNDIDKETIYQEWKENNIKPLRFNIYHGN